MGPNTLRRLTVLGTGLIGTSVALAARRAGMRVRLHDRDPDALATAVRMGAGVALAPRHPPADVVVIATPPSSVVAVLRDAQARGLGAVYTDVAGAKARILADAERTGCDLATFVPGHPMAGRELSGPAAARPDLFTGRRWALCPHPATPPGHVRTVAELVRRCGARPETLAPHTHDQVVAAVSHAPHLVSAALAAGFAGARDTVVAWAGDGLRDTTRIAAGAPELWCDILRHNAEPVAAVLDAVARELSEVSRVLRHRRDGGYDALADLLARGNQGRERIAGTRFPAAA